MYAVLFDIDGTLMLTGGAGSTAFAHTFRELFDVASLPPSVSFAGRSDRAIAEDIMRCCDIEPTDENWNRFFEGYCERLDVALNACAGHVLPGVLELVDALAADQHAAIGLLTGNTRFGANAKTSAYGLADRFAFGGFGDVHTDRNDIAADAQQAAQRFVAKQHGEQLCGTMVIGDTPADIRCGRAIGAFVAAVATGSSTTDELAQFTPDLLLEDLTDTTALMAEVTEAERRCRRLARA